MAATLEFFQEGLPRFFLLSGQLLEKGEFLKFINSCNSQCCLTVF